MKGGEFVDLVSELGRRRGVPVRFDPKRGKSSHGTLYYGSRKTTVKDRRQEIGRGLLNAMLKQIGLTRDDLGGQE